MSVNPPHDGASGAPDPAANWAAKSVAIELDTVYFGLQLGIAGRMRDRFGCEVHLYTQTANEAIAFRHLVEDGYCDSIQHCNRLIECARENGLDDEAVIARARGFEKKIGTTMANLTLNNRFFGRGYSTGGVNSPRTDWAEEVTYVQMLHTYTEAVAFWDAEFDAKGIDTLINGARHAAVLARSRGIRVRMIDTGKYEDYWIWATTENYHTPAVERTYHALTSWKERSFERPYVFAVGSMARSFKKKTWYGALRRFLDFAAVRAYAHVRRLESRHSNRFVDVARMLFREQRVFGRMTGPEVLSLNDLENRPFVFFPLHKEPEYALQMMSPEFFHQIPAICSISRALPAGVVLAVKENYKCMGRRPSEFYDQIRDLKNVVFMDVRESGLETVRKAAATVTITGTAGFEAAVLGKPVINFGRHAMYNVLPHVMCVTDEEDVQRFVDRALSGEFDEREAKDLGSRYLEAVVRNSFDMRGVSESGKFSAEVRDREVLDKVIDRLAETFDLPDIDQVQRKGTFTPAVRATA